MIDQYLGNCITGLNGEWLLSQYASDATELAQIVENSVIQHMSVGDKRRIRNVLAMPINKFEFAVNRGKGIAYAYDDKQDIHYFFGWV